MASRRKKSSNAPALQAQPPAQAGGARGVLRGRNLWALAALVALVVFAGWLRSDRPSLAAQSNPSAPAGGPEQEAPPYTNRLINEKSPYLLQHAHNPVDWYPWSEKAFEKARREQKPIFLSVGYSTCHWCHVMERESFSDPGIAEIMNRHFVSIKVDREERPDVDRIYMTFVVATTGSGGWPMSVFLTPDLKPFFGGTYFPRDQLRTLLFRASEVWEKDRGKVLESAGQVTEALREYVNVGASTGTRLNEAVLHKAYEQIKASYDRTHGGFGGAPKFPRPVVFNFLLRYYARTGEKDAREMTLHTLRAMANGGIHDHLGGGFHRYSTDQTWHVPHFEKMLYDQAQLAISYLEAYQITRDPFFAEVARDILDYVLRDMHSDHGAFFSAEDADSRFEHEKPEHGEGAFYVWEAKEIDRILGTDAAAMFNYYYGVEAAGNVPPRQDIRGELKEKNILVVRHTIAEAAKQFGRSEADVRGLLAAARRKLFEARSRRPRPPLDDKVLTAWNGLMISALARGAQVLEEPRYLVAAHGAARFLRTKLYDPKDGKLKRRYRDGEVAIDGFLEDYAFLIQGLLDLYEASFTVEWLTWAIQLQEKQDGLFWDSTTGGYFDTTGQDPSLLFRMREDYDGAEPAPNSVAAMNLLRLWQMTDRKLWREKAEKTFAAFAARLRAAPQTLPQLVVAMDFSLSKPKQIVIAGAPNAADTHVLLRLVHDGSYPTRSSYWLTAPKAKSSWLSGCHSLSS